MNKKNVYFTMLVLFAGLLYNCTKDSIVPDPIPIPDPIPDLVIDEKTLDLEFFNAVPTDGGSRELKFQSSSDWTITLNDTRSSSWLNITPSSGEAGNITATIAALENNTPDERQSKITISAGLTTKYIDVIQKQKDALIITSSRFELTKEGGDIKVEVKANIDFEFVMPDVDWIQESTTKVLLSHTRYFNILPNETFEARSAKIIFKKKDNTVSDTVTISQAQKETIVILNKEYTIDKNGGEIDIEVISNVEFDISIDSNWISQITTRALEIHNLKFKIEPYSGEIRRSKITIKDKNTSLSKNITITQTGSIVPNFYESTDYSKDGEVLTLQTATVGDGIDIVIVGDAFSDKDMNTGGKYEQRMGEAMNHFFSEEPYKTYRNRYNVYSVKAVSKNEVYEKGSQTIFSSKFLGGTGINGDHNKIFTYAIKVPSIADTRNLTIITVLNSPIYAGTCYMWANNASISYCPIVKNDNERFRQIITHEAGGHGFAKLFDEYSYLKSITIKAKENYLTWKDLGWGANSDITNNPATICWAHILSDTRYTGLVGIYEGSMTFKQGAYRPTLESIMRYNTGGFNPPSREAIFNWIMEYSGESYDYEKFVAYDTTNRTASAMATRRVQAARVDTKNFVPLAPPVLIISSPNVSK